MQVHPHINVCLVPFNREAVSILLLGKLFIQKIFIKDFRLGLHLIIHFVLFYPFLHSYCRACFMGSFIPRDRDGNLSWIPAFLPNSVKVSFLGYL